MALDDVHHQTTRPAEPCPTEDSAVLGLGHRGTHGRQRARILPPDIDIRQFGADSEGGYGQTLEHRVRVVLQQDAVHVGAGITFVRVHHDHPRAARR